MKNMLEHDQKHLSHIYYHTKGWFLHGLGNGEKSNMFAYK